MFVDLALCRSNHWVDASQIAALTFVERKVPRADFACVFYFFVTL